MLINVLTVLLLFKRKLDLIQKIDSHNMTLYLNKQICNIDSKSRMYYDKPLTT